MLAAGAAMKLSEFGGIYFNFNGGGGGGVARKKLNGDFFFFFLAFFCKIQCKLY